MLKYFKWLFLDKTDHEWIYSNTNDDPCWPEVARDLGLKLHEANTRKCEKCGSIEHLDSDGWRLTMDDPRESYYICSASS